MKHPMIDALYAAYNMHSPADLRVLYAGDAVHEDVPLGKTKIGRDEISAGMGRFFDWFPDAHWQAIGEVVDEMVIASPYILTGTLQSDFYDVQAAGQRIDLRGVHILHLSEDRIVRSEDYWDFATFQQQIKITSKES